MLARSNDGPASRKISFYLKEQLDMTDKLYDGDCKKGLGDLFPEVGMDIGPATREHIRQSKATAQTKVPPQPSSGSSTKWFWGAGVAMVVLARIGNSEESENAPYSMPPKYSPTLHAPAAAPEPATAPASDNSSVLPGEEKPPVGANRVLEVAQIRYCLAEDIRLEAAKEAVNNYNKSDVDSFNAIVDSFNAMVEDFKNRCGKIQYRKGALESARSDVEPYRGKLQLEGSIRILHLHQ